MDLPSASGGIVSNLGCGFPTDLGDESTTCGTFLGLGELVPILCDPCTRAVIASQNALRTRQAPAGATCEGCREQPATSTHPDLCAGCRADYDADLGDLEHRR